MAIDPVELQGLKVVIVSIAAIAAVVAVLWIPPKRLGPRMRLWLTFASLLLSWLFVANTALVLTRKGYCETKPIWPPFTGTPVDAPQWLMAGVGLLAIVSLPLLVMSIFTRRRDT